ncbi:GerMN domain-containing protein [Phosphitispora sp. TUW77]|uniref:GerMN domain-containing protein n=1 Tax=Phosphitispora sp. TUW77 TaxID=3152361 RepID=UPI003AB2CFDA
MRSKRIRHTRYFGLTVLVVLLALVIGCGLTGSQDKNNMDQNKSQVEEQDNSQTPPVNPQPTEEQVEITLYFSDDQAMFLKPEKRTVEKGGKPLANLLIEQLIEGPRTEGLHRTIPEEAKLISVEVVDGVAFVNFSREMQTKHWGGSAGERMTSQSVAHTLAQLPEVEKVQFLIEGKKEEAIWGHGYTGEPVAPESDIISGE